MDNSSREDVKRRETIKHQLKTMPKSNSTLSADAMIENLLSKKEIFQKKKTEPNEDSASHDKGGPKWLQPGEENPSYLSIWQWCRQPTGYLADTSKLSTLLITSGLTTDTLGYIWSLANRTVAGALTQKEVYLTLALVALAQKGYSFTSGAVVNQLAAPQCLPVLDMSMIRPMAKNSTPVFPPGNLVSGAGNFAASQGPIFPSSSLAASAQGGNYAPTGVAPFSARAGASALPIAPQPVQTVASCLGLTPAPYILDPPVLSSLPSSHPSTPLSPQRLPMQPTTPVYLPTSAPSVLDDEEFDDFKSADLPIQAPPLTVIQNPVASPLVVPEVPSLLELTNESISTVPHLPTAVTAPPVNSSSVNIPSKEDYLSSLLDLDSLRLDSSAKSDGLQPSGRLSLSNEKEKTKVEAEVETPVKTLPPSLDPTVCFKIPSDPATLDDLFPRCVVKKEADLLGLDEDEPTQDRYSVFRQLQEPSPPTEPEESSPDDFGDFLTARPLSPPPPSFNIQEECLQACYKVLKAALNTYNSIRDDPTVVTEVVSDPHGKQYIEGLVEVYRVSERIQKSSEPSPLHEDVNAVWGALEEFIHGVDCSNLEDEEEGGKCGICLSEVGPAHVRYGMNTYHAPCANLYVHIVGHSLPIAPM